MIVARLAIEFGYIEKHNLVCRSDPILASQPLKRRDPCGTHKADEQALPMIP